MPKYRIRLGQLHSSFMRNKEQDDLNMAVLRVMVDGNVIAPETAPADGSLGNPVTGQLASGVHSGDTILFLDFTPDNAAALEFSFDGNLPDDWWFKFQSLSLIHTASQIRPHCGRP